MKNSSDYILDSSREYAIYVCDTRGIPSVIDGLKSGQRMALWALRDKSEKIKTFALTGLLGSLKLFVHGEASCNNAIGLLAAPYKNNHCLIEGLGQFGNRIAPDKDGIGAPRYTEVRRAKISEAILYKDLDLIPLVDNYDGSNKQPEHFLPLIPTVLLNGISGVAVGWSTDILPRSLKSLIEATKAALLGQPIGNLTPHYERYNIKVTSTGKPNQWEYSGAAEIVDTSTIRVTELPPGMSIESFRAKLIEMEDTDVIMNFTDRSTENINIFIKMKRGSIAGWNEEKALDFFKIREKVTERIVTIDWSGNSIRTYDNPQKLVMDFAQWRLAWYTKRYEKMLFDDTYELNYWYALRALFEMKFPTRLGGFLNKEDVEKSVQEIVDLKNIKVDNPQLERIVNLPTYKWNTDFLLEINKHIDALEKSIASHKDILGSPNKLLKVYIDELDALKSFKG